MPRHLSLHDLPPHLREQAEAQVGKRSRRRKYGNVPTVVDGHKCPSRLEARRHHELNLMTVLGAIFGHVSHVRIRLPSKSVMELDELVNEPVTHSCPECVTPYICPICGKDNLIPTLVLEDSKGLMTEAWKVKCRELEQALGIKVRIIRG